VTQRNGSTSNSYVRQSNGSPVAYRASAGHYYVLDNLGSVVGLFSGTGTFEGGYSYAPYGEARFTATATAVTSNPLQYIGGYKDSTGLYKLGARYYDTGAGRFTQFDPSGQESNPYAYAACNPINAKDPTGLDAACILGVLAGLGVAFLVVTEIVDIAASIATLPLTGGASVIAGAALAAGLSVELAAAIGFAGYELSQCV
jgi:RHS repeat-associated protein